MYKYVCTRTHLQRNGSIIMFCSPFSAFFLPLFLHFPLPNLFLFLNLLSQIRCFCLCDFLSLSTLGNSKRNKRIWNMLTAFHCVDMRLWELGESFPILFLPSLASSSSFSIPCSLWTERRDSKLPTARVKAWCGLGLWGLGAHLALGGRGGLTVSRPFSSLCSVWDSRGC